MTKHEFYRQLDLRIAKYDLLCHPFYKAWAAGELTREDLREYALDYFAQVEAFPQYLADFSARLGPCELRDAVIANMNDENGHGHGGPESRPHTELWLDFAEGMGASRDGSQEKITSMKQLTAFFKHLANAGSKDEALASFYAYESQVPRVAEEKARGLRELYGAEEKACGYFTLHMTADRYHSQVWKDHLGTCVEGDLQSAERALNTAEATAKVLWLALDGIEAKRLSRAA